MPAMLLSNHHIRIFYRTFLLELQQFLTQVKSEAGLFDSRSFQIFRVFISCLILRLLWFKVFLTFFTFPFSALRVFLIRCLSGEATLCTETSTHQSQRLFTIGITLPQCTPHQILKRLSSYARLHV